MKKTKSIETTTIEITTGECCPVSGLWKATIYPFMPARIVKGKIMPPQLEQPVIWELTLKDAMNKISTYLVKN